MRKMIVSRSEMRQNESILISNKWEMVGQRKKSTKLSFHSEFKIRKTISLKSTCRKRKSFSDVLPHLALEYQVHSDLENTWKNESIRRKRSFKWQKLSEVLAFR